MSLCVDTDATGKIEIGEIYYQPNDSLSTEIAEIWREDDEGLKLLWQNGIWVTYNDNKPIVFETLDKNVIYYFDELIEYNKSGYIATNISDYIYLKYRYDRTVYAHQEEIIGEPFCNNKYLSNKLSIISLTDTGKNIAGILYDFKGCKNLTSIYLPLVSAIWLDTFANCSNLSSVYMPKLSLVTNYWGCQFENCFNIRNIDFPLLTSIGLCMFRFCYNLSSININNCTYIDNNGFYDCSNLISINFNKILNINNNAFYNCSKLSSIECPNVKNIGEKAFNGCIQLTSINCLNVLSIGNYAFYGCSKLSSVILSSVTSVPTVYSTSFGTMRNWPVAVYIPNGMYDAFMNNSTWNTLVRNMIIELDEA